MIRTLVGWAIGLVVLPVVVLIGVEGITRLTAPDDLVLQRSDPGLIDASVFPHVNRAGFYGFVRQGATRINAHHLRGSEVEFDTRLRVLLLGDSVLFGPGIDQEDSPGPVLEGLLEGRAQVFNASTIGHATGHQAAWLERYGDGLLPDLLVLGYCLNDPLPADRPSLGSQVPTGLLQGAALSANRILQSRSLFFVWLKGTLGVESRRHGFEEHVAPLFADSLWQANQVDLETILAWAARREIPFLLAVFPHREQLQRAGLDEPQRQLSGWAANAGVPVLNLAEILDPAHYLFGDPIHLNHSGLQNSLEAMARWIRSTDRYAGPEPAS
jgi:lysophospholipase L1-like esterase